MPDQDVVELLVAQHARIEELFATVITTSGAVQQDAFHELVRLLAVQEPTEEETVHPLAGRAIGVGDTVVDARLAEERAARELLADLHDAGPGDPRFDAGIVALRDAVLAHVTYEERYEFPRLRHEVSSSLTRRGMPTGGTPAGTRCGVEVC